ncbi:TrbI/VirB10 family protein [Burkholderia multivorans]|uniref:TrbI/VirB10 family protein n=2 Tax=Burkholderia multivorans TaxID=87883 RepID=UPI0009B8E3F1|nr:TrbI/VirB10 family protein [Burkholderia multivorans]MDR9230047.1 Protein virB10 [Burkholderia multivorans]HDR9474414.1 TrbI/VirB10 family protein [Burkholderia multivorans]HDR9480256.1 TrbI/VirB10 family protein [Burkholderia multivorans]
MRLRDKSVEAADQDRTELNERIVAGATPGQKLIGGLTALVAVGVIIGGLAYKFWYLPAHGGPVPAGLQQQQQKADQTPPKSPTLTVPTTAGTATVPGMPDGGQRPLPPGMMGARPDGGATSAQEDQSQANAQAEQLRLQAEEKERQARAAAKAEVLKRKFSSDMGAMPGTTTSGIMPAAAQPAPQPVGSPAFPMPGMGSNNAAQSGDFSARLIPTSTPRVSATLIPNPTFTVKKGTPIRCTLDTAMNSDTPGFVSCTVSRPVYGMDGRVVLIDRGSTVDGELARGPERGKKRAAVLWGRIVTPYNVAIQVNSPGTDTLGAPGLTGSIDNHYCERFCGAFLFSSIEDVIQGGMQALTNKSSGNTNIVLPQNTLNSGQTAAAEILQQGRDVQPTFSKNQGDEISITVARDLDFSTAYHLESAQR